MEPLDSSKNPYFSNKNVLCVSGLTLLAIGVLALKKLPRNPTIHGRVKLSHLTSALSFAAGATLLGFGLNTKKDSPTPTPRIKDLKGEELANALGDLSENCEVLILDGCTFEDNELASIPKNVKSVIFDGKWCAKGLEHLPDHIEEIEITPSCIIEGKKPLKNVSKKIRVCVESPCVELLNKFYDDHKIPNYDSYNLSCPQNCIAFKSPPTKEELKATQSSHVRFYGVNSDWSAPLETKRFNSIDFHGGIPQESVLNSLKANFLKFSQISDLENLAFLNSGITEIMLEPTNPISEEDAKNIPASIKYLELSCKFLPGKGASVIPAYIEELAIISKNHAPLPENLVEIKNRNCQLHVVDWDLTENGVSTLTKDLNYLEEKNSLIQKCLATVNNLSKKIDDVQENFKLKQVPDLESYKKNITNLQNSTLSNLPETLTELHRKVGEMEYYSRIHTLKTFESNLIELNLLKGTVKNFIKGGLRIYDCSNLEALKDLPEHVEAVYVHNSKKSEVQNFVPSHVSVETY